METQKKTIQGLGIKTGLVTSFFLIAYFLLMKALNLAQISELRYLNFFILLIGVIYAYKHYREPGHNIEYLPGLGLGMITTASAVIPFSIFIYHYFWFIDPNLLTAIEQNSVIMAAYLNPTTVAGAILMEGMASGAIISLVLMQHYKSGFEKEEKHSWLHG